MSLFQKGLLVVALLVASQIGIFAYLIAAHLNLCAETDKIQKSLSLSRVFATSLVHMLFLTRSGHQMMSVSDGEMDALVKTISSELNTMLEMVKDRPERRAAVETCRRSGTRLLALIESARMMKRQGTFLPGVQNPGAIFRQAGSAAMNDSNRLIDFLEEEQNSVKQAFLKQKEMEDANLRLLEIAICAEVLLAIASVVWFRFDITRRMNVIIKNNERLVKDEPLLDVLAGADEITTLDRAFHAVAEALKAAEENERAMIENAQDMICELDENLAIRRANAASLELLGLDPDQLTGKPLAELALSEESGWLAQKFEQARLQELPRFETKLARHDGKPVDVSFSVRWSADRRSFTCVIHDISSVKNAERLRQEVMQMVSHDLKSPLFTVSSFLEMYQESMIGSPSEAGKHRIQEAFSGCSQMLALIGNLLDMEKLNAGMLDLQKESLSLDACLEEARQAVGEELAARDIVIDWRPSAQALTVTGDRERLLQVFTGIFKQLLENPDAGQRITILAERLTAAQVEIRFLTNGSAVLPARQFASQLAIDVMRALVELHGGSLIVAGQRSAGADSLYTLRLPAAR